jgi:ABC-type sugar transport system substrate-binding protein
LVRQVLRDHPRLTKKKKRKTKVLISYNKPGETVTDQQLAGIKSVISRYADAMELVLPIVEDGGNDKQGEKEIARMLTKHSDIKVIFGLNARSAMGAMKALAARNRRSGQAHKPGDVIVTGWDSDEDVLNGIRDGWIHSTSVLYSSLCTQIGFGILEAHNLGYLYPESRQLRELAFPAAPDKILIPETLITKNTVEGYRRKRRELDLHHRQHTRDSLGAKAVKKWGTNVTGWRETL